MTIDTQYLDADGDKIKLARPALLDMAQRVNALSTVSAATIAALKAVDKTKFSRAIVLGYYAASDGGGGVYQYDSSDTTSADNGGTIIVATDGGRWKLVTNSMVSVRQFGAKGDGATNDTTALTNAIASGKALYFPDGNYLNTAQQTISSSNIGYVFAPGAKITHQADTICLLLSGAVNVKFDKLSIYSPGYGQNNAGLVQVNSSSSDITFIAPRIAADNAAGKSRSRVFDGFAFSTGSTRCSVIGGVVDGVTKNCYYPATGSSDISFVDCVAANNGNHATGTYGYSIGFGGVGIRTRYTNCAAINTQGFGFVAFGESDATYGNPNSFGTIFNGCIAYNTRGGFQTASLSGSIAPSHVSFVNCESLQSTLYGFEFAIGLNIELNGAKVYGCQSSAYRYGANTTLRVRNVAPLASNWNQANGANNLAHDINSSASVIIDNPELYHDGTGVTTLNCFGTAASSQTISKLVIRNLNISGALTASNLWSWFSTVSAGNFEWFQAGAPAAGAQAPNGSLVRRTDGVGTTDNLYIRRGGAWVGIA